MPEIAAASSAKASRSSTPFQPLRMPRKRSPNTVPRLTSARMTAFSPGASPPPVNTPIVILLPPSDVPIVERRVLLRRGKEQGTFSRDPLRPPRGGLHLDLERDPLLAGVERGERDAGL